MPVDVVTETIIERPRAQVATYAGNPSVTRSRSSAYIRSSLSRRAAASPANLPKSRCVLSTRRHKRHQPLRDGPRFH